MKAHLFHGLVISSTGLLLGACSSVQDFMGVDPGRVQLSCSSSGPVAGTPPLQMSLSPLSPSTKIEILRPAPDKSVLLTLPAGATGDVISYDWKEATAGAGRPPGLWQCRVGWRFDGQVWQLQHLDAQWMGGIQQNQ